MYKKLCILLISYLVIGFAAYSFGKNIQPTTNKTVNQSKTLREGENGLINPILDCEISQNVYIPELKNFQDKVQNIIDVDKKEGKIEDAAIYYRDMQDGPWFGINANEKFAPASLLKVPVMIAFYRLAENNPAILATKLAYDSSDPFPDENSGEHFKPSNEIKRGKTYTVNELIYYMVVHSDNNALDLLLFHLSLADEERVFTDLSLPDILTQKPQANVLSVVDYSTFFRVLYNASYLDTDMSEKALELLANDDFTNGIESGLPKNILYAGKFGERTVGDEKQLHDCGIVYYPASPYLLCIMTRGKDYNQLTSAISEISQAVYNEVNKQIPH